MWMCDVTILMDPKNPDRNSCMDVVAGLKDVGASVGSVDVEGCVIEAAVPSHLVHLIGAFGGVSYVRTVFQYLADDRNLASAR